MGHGVVRQRPSLLRSNINAVKGLEHEGCIVQRAVNVNHLSPFNNQLFLL